MLLQVQPFTLLVECMFTKCTGLMLAMRKGDHQKPVVTTMTRVVCPNTYGKYTTIRKFYCLHPSFIDTGYVTLQQDSASKVPSQ
jgi:hypothetical protein